MAGKSKIEWCTDTWNPIVGCSIVSPGCTNCYAMGQAERIVRMAKGARKKSHYAGTTELVKGKAVWTGKLALAPEHILTAPLRWTKPRRIFVNSMGDLFHEDVPDGWIMHVFDVMWNCPQHTFQILTKRPDRMRAFMEKWTDLNGENFDPKLVRGPEETRKAHPSGRGQLFAAYLDTLLERSGGTIPDGAAWPTFDWAGGMIMWPDFPPNVWLGVSAERQKEADERIPDLLMTPAAIRFVSCEPLLGGIDLTAIRFHDEDDVEIRINALTAEAWVEDSLSGSAYTNEADGNTRLDWVIVGGESGKNSRPMHPDWAHSLRNQCQAAGVAYFHKQNGSYEVIYDRGHDDPDWRRCDVVERKDPKGRWLNLEGGHGFHGERVVYAVPRNKIAAGRLLDGREWNEFPLTRETF